MAEKFVGSYKLESSEKFDEYLQAMGANPIIRAAANNATPTTEIAIAADGTWTMKFVTPMKTIEIKFKLDQEFEETTMDGRKVKTIFKLDNGKLTQSQKAIKAGERSLNIIREIKDDKLVQTMPIDDFECKRIFKRQ